MRLCGRRITRAPALVLALLLPGAASKASPLFMGLGDLPGGRFDSVAEAISPDGSVVVGRSDTASGTEAFRWTAATGMLYLGGLPGSSTSTGQGVSAGGAIIAGRSSSPIEAFRWSESAGFQGLGGIQTGARDISFDGSVIVGTQQAGGGIPYRWTQSTGLVDLGINGGDANAISGDGSVIVGFRQDSLFRDEAFRWIAGTGEVGLGFLSGDNASEARDVSADGAIVVGSSGSNRKTAFRWTQGTGMVGLDPLPGAFASSAEGISGDGNLIVGNSGGAFIWDAQQGTRDLRDVLVNDFGLDLTGWALIAATDVSADGRIIVGTGLNPSGKREAWIAAIPEPAIGALVAMGLGIVALRRQDRSP